MDTSTLQKNLRTLFQFTRSETRAIFFLLLGIIVFQIIRNYLIYQDTQPVPISKNNTLLVQKIQQAVKEEEAVFSFSEQKRYDKNDVDYTSKYTYKKQNLGSFDPNIASFEELVHIGFYPNVANTILKYRNKGGVFKSSEDLLKIYGMSPIFYERIKSQIKINSIKQDNVYASSNNFEIKQNSPAFSTYEKYKKEEVKIDLNTATEQDLERLSGIGKTLAERIVKYRNSLGGFYSETQLKEVYGITDSVFEKNLWNVTVKNSIISKQNLNAMSQEDMAKHPYIGKVLAAQIKNYRANKGALENHKQLITIFKIEPERAEKIRQYFNVDIIY